MDRTFFLAGAVLAAMLPFATWGQEWTETLDELRANHPDGAMELETRFQEALGVYGFTVDVPPDATTLRNLGWTDDEIESLDNELTSIVNQYITKQETETLVVMYTGSIRGLTIFGGGYEGCGQSSLGAHPISVGRDMCEWGVANSFRYVGRTFIRCYPCEGYLIPPEDDEPEPDPQPSLPTTDPHDPDECPEDAAEAPSARARSSCGPKAPTFPGPDITVPPGMGDLNEP